MSTDNLPALVSREFPRSFIGFILARRNLCWVAVCALLFSASLSRYWVSYNPAESLVPSWEPARLAYNLYERGQFADPFAALDTGPSAIVPPVYPAFLALLIKAFGEKSAGIYAIKLAPALALSLQIALFPLFSKMLGMGGLNGIMAACIWIVGKPRLAHGPWAFESPYAGILVALACCLYRRFLDPPSKRGCGVPWLLGCSMGLLLLTIPTVALVLVAWLGWEIWQRRSAFFKASLVPLVLLPALIVAPWTIRNYLTLHSFVLVRDNAGLELSVSNNDCAQFAFQQEVDSGCYDKFHPNHNISEAMKVKALGEVKDNELRLWQALHWMRTHPGRFAKLSAMRFVAFWLPTESGTIHYAGTGRRLERVVIYLMTFLSGLGLLILYRQDVKSAAVCLSCLALFPLVYYTVHFLDRYRYPIMWVTFLLGALPITAHIGEFWKSLSALNATPDLLNLARKRLRHRYLKAVGKDGNS